MDRRHQPRVPLSALAYVTYDGRCREERVVDASASGVSLTSGARLRVGQAVQVFVPIADGRGAQRMTLMKGEVVRRFRRAGGERGVGIAFAPGVRDTRALFAASLPA